MDVLQSFLNARLFDVSADDTRVERLREASADLATTIKVAPERVAAFTMVAIDGAVGPNEPLIAEVTEMLGKRWQSYAGAFADDKIPTVARAIILQALASLIGGDAVAASVAATARNMLPRLGSRKDESLWTGLITAADERLDQRARREWGVRVVDAPTPFEVPTPGEIVIPGVNRKWLLGRMKAAAGPSDAEGNTLEKPNSQFPNSGPPWSYEFAPIAAEAIAAVVDSVVKALAERLDPTAALKAMGPALQEYATELSKAQTASLQVLERRSQLLWWKEALFSPTANVSYRSIDPALAAALAAADASEQSGPFAPRTAEHLVWETVRGIAPDLMTPSRSLVKMCQTVQADTSLAGTACRVAFSRIASSAGRTPLGALLGADTEIDGAAIEHRLGLAATVEISPPDLALWLFRDLQASAATPRQPRRKKPGRS